jgi:hypothetical protein
VLTTTRMFEKHPRGRPTIHLPKSSFTRTASLAARGGSGIISPAGRLSTGFLDSLESQGSVDSPRPSQVFFNPGGTSRIGTRAGRAAGDRLLMLMTPAGTFVAAVQGTAARLAKSWQFADEPVRSAIRSLYTLRR